MQEIRARRGLTQTELATRIGASNNQVGRYEAGESDPSIEVLVRLVNQLGVSADWLIGVSDVENRTPDGLSPLEIQLLEALRSRNTATILRIATQTINSI